MKVSCVVCAWIILISTVQSSFADPCKDLKSEAPSSVSQQKASYCATAQSADEAAKGHERSAKIQAGVAAICTLTCSKSLFSVGLGEGYCSSAALLGVVGSVAVSKETESNMSSILMGMENLRQATQMDMEDWSFSYKVTSQEEEKSKTACLTAAMATLQALMSDQAKEDAEKTAKENRELAASLTSEQKEIELKDPNLATQMSHSAKPSQLGSYGSAALAPLGRSASPHKTQAGSKKGTECSGTDFDSTVACALSNEKTVLPSFVGTPEFKEALEHSTGMTADQFVSLDSAKSAIQAGVLKGLGTLGTAKLSAALNKAQANLARPESSSVYAARGTGADSDFKTLLEGILGKNDPQTAKAPASSRAQALFYGRKPASKRGDEENRTLSLFDRITSRYQTSIYRREFRVELKRFTR